MIGTPVGEVALARPELASPTGQIGESFRLLSRLAGAFNMSRAQASDQCLVECLPIASMQMWR